MPKFYKVAEVLQGSIVLRLSFPFKKDKILKQENQQYYCLLFIAQSGSLPLFIDLAKIRYFLVLKYDCCERSNAKYGSKLAQISVDF